MQRAYVPYGIETNSILRQPLCKSAAALAHISHLHDDVLPISVLSIVALLSISLYVACAAQAEKMTKNKE